jgi:hypothetical protein
MPMEHLRLFVLPRLRSRCSDKSLENNLQLQLGEKNADLRVVLFVRRFRRFRGGEFLEARIIPKRIEHWIEP